MASSPTSNQTIAAADIAFALRELIACWDQGYEALARGDLDRVTALMSIADQHAVRLTPVRHPSEELAALQREAQAARGRLEHGMKAGMEGLRKELRQVREGAKALGGYRDATLDLGRRIARHA